MRSAGNLDPPLHFQFVLGAPFGMPADAASLVYLTGFSRRRSTWSVIGIGRAQTPMAALALVMGGHVRVGLEDNIYYRKGEFATSNAQLVERVVRLAGELGRPVATPADARRHPVAEELGGRAGPVASAAPAPASLRRPPLRRPPPPSRYR